MAWIKPRESGFRTGLHILNSLTNTKEEFLTSTGDRRVYWYMCGPTVYDASHLGHARTYVCFDAIRRIMTDYFGYHVTLCMNITDIDDKIIKASLEHKVPFDEYSRKWEMEFLRDMEALNVKPPEVITRVSEYVPDIITYIEKIISNGYGYESNGSVYFDTQQFKETHSYGKLEPTSVDNTDKIAEGEGDTDVKSPDKKRPQDFALWKKSKENEPSWDSPWGKGRPGWHIECSVMACDVLPCPMDIHSGGVDLKFPHHDNELAQSEAYFDCNQWVNYFIHTGHLHIQGLKMSKSLKNFITIRKILETYNARQVRILFLLHKWDALMNYSFTSIDEAIERERQFNEFFLNLSVKLRETPANSVQRWGERERTLHSSFEEMRLKIHEYFCDNFATDSVLDELSLLLNRTNTYMQGEVRAPLLDSIGKYMKHILACLGLDYSMAAVAGSDKVSPILDIICKFRDEIRDAARNKDFAGVLKVCDRVRDSDLIDVGVRLEDRPGQPSVWKFGDVEELKKERVRKQEEELKKQQKKEEALKKKAAKEAEIIEKAKLPAEEMFKSDENYSAFDEQGIPTHDSKSEPVSKSLRKKLQKTWEKQKELNNKYGSS
jgi:cysteinyl-tRNA synthetase